MSDIIQQDPLPQLQSDLRDQVQGNINNQSEQDQLQEQNRLEKTQVESNLSVS